jgi:hypothetical protein
MIFICFFIFFGSITFFIILKLAPSFSLLHIIYLTPIVQKLPQPFFSFSKKLFFFSDLAWLEKFSFLELSQSSNKSSFILYKVIREKPLIKQIIIVCLFFFLLTCF